MNDWAEGEMVGKTQEETGYKSSMGVAKYGILEEFIEDMLLPHEEGEKTNDN